MATLPPLTLPRPPAAARWRRPGAGWRALALSAALGCGACDLPVTPGSDLPSLLDAHAESSALPDLAVEERAWALDGRFALRAQLASPLGDTIETSFVVDIQSAAQEGAPSASLVLTLRSADDPDAAGPTTEEPVPLSPGGAFTAVFRGYVIPGEFSDALPGDTESDITLDAQALSDDCLTGTLEVRLTGFLGIRLVGPFLGTREGADCDA